MNIKKRWLIPVLTMGLIAAIILAAAGPAAGQAVTLAFDPSSACPGDTLNVSATGLAPATGYNIRMDGDGPETLPLAQTYTDGSGNLDAYIAMPEGAPGSTLSIFAAEINDPGQTAVAEGTVDVSSACPTISVDPVNGCPGTYITIGGTNAPADAPIGIFLCDQGLNPGCVSLGDTTSDDTGNWLLNTTVPSIHHDIYLLAANASGGQEAIATTYFEVENCSTVAWDVYTDAYSQPTQGTTITSLPSTGFPVVPFVGTLGAGLLFITATIIKKARRH
jgi:hypothetical protein